MAKSPKVRTIPPINEGISKRRHGTGSGFCVVVTGAGVVVVVVVEVVVDGVVLVVGVIVVVVEVVGVSLVVVVVVVGEVVGVTVDVVVSLPSGAVVGTTVLFPGTSTVELVFGTSANKLQYFISVYSLFKIYNFLLIKRLDVNPYNYVSCSCSCSRTNRHVLFLSIFNSDD